MTKPTDDAGDLFRRDDPPASERVAATSAATADGPLAERLRPRSLDDVVGQPHLLAPDRPIGRMVARGRLASTIFWGPPGVGKTTIARLLAHAAGYRFVPLSAVFSGVADLKRAFEASARERRAGRRTVLFVDEIHRFNRSQQDGFLPAVECGDVLLLGATTENPSFALNGALLSRCQVAVLRRLDDEALEALLCQAETVERAGLSLTPGARASLRAMADGDGRALLNMAEQVFAAGPGALDEAGLAQLLARRPALYDRDREEHFNLVSALHKSIRGSDADAALYWLARMLEGGEDPRYVMRRLLRLASEDVGLADPDALPQVANAWQAYERLGSPEGELAIAQAVLYLANCPKSNAVYAAYKAARACARETGSLPPPAHVLNAPTAMMRDLGYGAGYVYDHDQTGAFSGQDYFPAGMARPSLYRPTDRGQEAAVAARMAGWRATRDSKP